MQLLKFKDDLTSINLLEESILEIDNNNFQESDNNFQDPFNF